MNDDLYDLASKWISESDHSVAFTGAGISVESGIPTFRGEDGLWNKYNPIFLDTNYFVENPKKSWILIKEIFYDFFGKAKPNVAHQVLAEMEKRGYIKSIITQNIDNLHQLAGSKNVLEFHGTSKTLTCLNCNSKYDHGKLIENLPPHCPKCNGLLKPDFVFFGEPIPEAVHNNSIKEATISDLFILIGTTGEIMPASMIPFIAKKNGAKFIEINIERSKYTDSIVDIYLQGKATVVLKKLKNILFS
ncbi:MAG: NAD-dependent protein deacylase [Candidatus Helarchaeota archaeon]